MPASPFNIPSSNIRLLSGALAVCVSVVALGAIQTASAESLFRAGVSHQANMNEGYVPHSLFTQPRPQRVGDIVTIQISETSQNQLQIQGNIRKGQELEQNGSTLFNRAVSFMLDKVPFLSDRAVSQTSDFLAVPNFDGYENNSQITSNIQSTRKSNFTETVACQVVQVLPNGYLVVQGHKRNLLSKEQTDMFVSGVVNPYYIDRNNSIQSGQVANLQVMMGGKGVISRQQNDGIASKVYQFFN